MSDLRLSSHLRKTLCVQIGEVAGGELAKLLHDLLLRVEALERTKVSVTTIAPPDDENLNDVLPRRRAG